MNTKAAYNNWANTYDTVANKTRDLEAIAIRTVLAESFHPVILEIGCGTGKNTIWLAGKTDRLIAADFSEEMLLQARQKITDKNVAFTNADITKEWAFDKVNLITCSLVLEHIQDLSFIFQQAAKTLECQGQFYICELHPYKQLQGSRAKFEKEGELHELEYFIHYISAYFSAATAYGFTCRHLQEWFDDDNQQLPRLVSFLFEKVDGVDCLDDGKSRQEK